MDRLIYSATNMLGEGNISNEGDKTDSDTEELGDSDDRDENKEFDVDEVSSEEGDDIDDEGEDEDDSEAGVEDAEEPGDDSEEMEGAVEAKEGFNEDEEAKEDGTSGIEISNLRSSGRNRKHVIFDEDEDFDGMEIPLFKVQEQPEETESEDSDAVPEEAAISKSKVESARQEKEIQEEVQRVKNKVREKRKKQHERNKKQKDDKRRRLDNLASKRLPSDLLKQVEEDMASKAMAEKMSPAQGSKKIVQKEASNKHKFLNESDDDGLEDGKESNLSDTEDVISLKKGVQVKTIKSEEKKYQALSNRAINFRQKILYGKRQDRIPGRQLHEMKVKQEKSGKAKLVR